MEILSFSGSLTRVEGNNGVFGSVNMEHRNDRDMTALDLARLRRGVAPAADQEKFEAIATLLIRFIEAPAKFAAHERRWPDGHTRGGLLAAVGTFFLGQRHEAPQAL